MERHMELNFYFIRNLKIEEQYFKCNVKEEKH